MSGIGVMNFILTPVLTSSHSDQQQMKLRACFFQIDNLLDASQCILLLLVVIVLLLLFIIIQD